MSHPPSTAKSIRSADGMTIYAEASGAHSNPHIVLIPGLGLSGAVFDDFCTDERLLNSVYAVRVDPRGQGRSSPATTAESQESKHYAEDFDAIVKAFDLHKPVLVAWSLGGALLCDIATHLPSFTLSGCVFLSGMPWAQELIQEVGRPEVLALLPGLASNDAREARAALRTFIDLIFREPAAVPYGKRLMYYGHDIDPDMLEAFSARTQDREKLRVAGAEGLPLLYVYGTQDGHQKGWVTLDYLKPWFRDMEVRAIERGSHALHEDDRDELVDVLLSFVGKIYGLECDLDTERESRITD